MTPLDRAHAEMEAAPEDPGARLRFYERLADAELVVPLVAEPEADAIEPQVFPLEDGQVVVAFDSEERLGAFAERAVPYAALSGRALAALLAGQGLGLGLNLAVAPSQTILPAQAVDWLARMLAARPEEARETPRELFSPRDLPPQLDAALRAKMGGMTGMAECAYLAGVAYDGGRRADLLAFVGARPGAEEALARAAGEAVAFSGLEDGGLDVIFVAPGDPLLARLDPVAIRFDLPRHPAPAAPKGPGLDPDAPPRLR